MFRVKWLKKKKKNFQSWLSQFSQLFIHFYQSGISNIINDNIYIPTLRFKLTLHNLKSLRAWPMRNTDKCYIIWQPNQLCFFGSL